jgi:hypothetical protein
MTAIPTTAGEGPAQPWTRRMLRDDDMPAAILRLCWQEERYDRHVMADLYPTDIISLFGSLPLAAFRGAACHSALIPVADRRTWASNFPLPIRGPSSTGKFDGFKPQ